jgi:hypothetical protein
MNANIEIIQKTKTPAKLYPYWAMDNSNALFLVIEPGKGIPINFGTGIHDIFEDLVTPLKPGDEIRIILWNNFYCPGA